MLHSLPFGTMCTLAKHYASWGAAFDLSWRLRIFVHLLLGSSLFGGFVYAVND